MPEFTYIARDEHGQTVHGEVTALTRQDASRAIRSEGKFIVQLVEGGRQAAGKRSRRAVRAPLLGRERIRPDELIFFTNQLAVMVDTGVALTEALDACNHEGNSPRFARALAAIGEQVQAGSPFSVALAEHPDIFPPVYVSMIRASEASGAMGLILRRLADHTENQREIRKKIKGAVAYPIVMLVFAIGVTIFLMSFVLPKFTGIYAGQEDALPGVTRALMALSDWLVAYGIYVLILAVAGLIGLILFLRGPAGRDWLDRFRLGLPMIGALYHKTYLSRSLRTLGAMIQAGVSMLDGVRLTAGVCASRYYERMWDSVREDLESGRQISEALADESQVPRSVKKMIQAGERSGRLGAVMERVAGFCEAELAISIKTMTGLIEPAIIMLLGVVVGGLVIALLLPIFTISKAL